MKSSIAFLLLVFTLGCSSFEDCSRNGIASLDSLYIPYLYSMPYSSPYASDYFGLLDSRFSSMLDESFSPRMSLMSAGDFSFSSPDSCCSLSSCSTCHD